MRFSFLVRLESYPCKIVFIIDKIRADVNLYRDSSHRNFFLDILFENDKIVLMKTNWFSWELFCLEGGNHG